MILLLFLSILAQAETRVAFIEVQGRDGKPVQLEPGGRFAHIAISLGDKWVHASPKNGVEIVGCKELEKIGKVKEVAVLDREEPSAKKFLGKPYDSSFSWSDEGIYCSELVGKLLGINAEPMQFDAPIWGENFNSLKGELGLSPDDIYKKLKKEGHTIEPGGC